MGEAVSVRALGFWRAVELFDQPELGEVERVRAGEPLPWDTEHPLARRELPSGTEWRHVVHVGIHPRGKALAVLAGAFGAPTPDADGDGALARFAVDDSGRALLGSAALSAAAWATGEVGLNGAAVLGRLTGFAQAQERFAAEFRATALGRLGHTELAACEDAAVRATGFSPADAEIGVTSTAVPRGTGAAWLPEPTSPFLAELDAAEPTAPALRDHLAGEPPEPGPADADAVHELVVGVLVRRARDLAELGHPREAFSGLRFRWLTADRAREVSAWRPELAGGGVLAVSADETTARAAGAAVRPAPAAADGATGHDWPLALTLVDRADRERFDEELWTGGAGLLDLLKTWEDNGPRRPWSDAVAAFRAARLLVDDLHARRAAASRAVDREPVLREELDRARAGLTAAIARLAEVRAHRDRLAAVERAAVDAHAELEQEAARQFTAIEHQVWGWNEELERRKGEHREHRKLRPALWKRVAKQDSDQHLWSWRDTWLSDRVKLAEAELKRLHATPPPQAPPPPPRTPGLDAAEQAVRAAVLAQADHEWVISERTAELARVEELLPVAAELFAGRERAEPWTDPEWTAARDALLLAALELHREFLGHEARAVRRNLQAVADLIAGESSPEMPDGAVGEAWRTLFLVTPLISVTAESGARLLAGAGPDSLGWLLLDRAVPPARAVGALRRARRVLAVGDGEPGTTPVERLLGPRWAALEAAAAAAAAAASAAPAHGGAGNPAPGTGFGGPGGGPGGGLPGTGMPGAGAAGSGLSGTWMTGAGAPGGGVPNSGTFSPAVPNPGPGGPNRGTLNPGARVSGVPGPGTLNPGARVSGAPGPGTLSPGARVPGASFPGALNPGSRVSGVPGGPVPAGPPPGGAMFGGPTPAGPVASGSTPAGPAPAGPVPPGSLPAGSIPAGSIPVRPNPASPTPAGPAPAGPTPAGPTPDHDIPAGPATVRHIPASPIPASPTPTGPTPADPVPGGDPRGSSEERPDDPDPGFSGRDLFGGGPGA
ncbi:MULTISPECIES: hypothetical protein [Actinosynnema]|uniref:hypothetical protein n=1 Tax=Actinosynnema TaxID=40566 RepID=UPI0020A540C2|nr:hypothetical protein [Actinosynnema pretiosum]